MTAWMRLTGEDPLQLVRIRGDAFGYAAMPAGSRRLIPIDADFDGEAAFDVAEAQTGRSHIDPGGALRTRCLRIDSYLRDRAIDAVALLKLDIEGYELAALRGAGDALERRAIKAIYFEYFEK